MQARRYSVLSVGAMEQILYSFHTEYTDVF